MRVIRIYDVALQYIFIFLFAGSLVAGVFSWPWFIVAAVALILYFVWGFWRLRCPWCGGPVEVSDLIRARRRQCHCPACGHEIIVVTKLGRLPEEPEEPAPPVTPAEQEPGWPEDADSRRSSPTRRETFSPEVMVDPDATIEEAVAAILGRDAKAGAAANDSTDPRAGEKNNTETEGSISK